MRTAYGQPMRSRLAAVVLAGGGARRLSGVDKPALEIGGRTLLRRAVDAVAGADPVVVVGPRRELDAEVCWTREDPPGTGPVAALAAALAVFPELPDDTEVALVAADLVNVSADTITRLRARLGDAGAVLVDETGARQWLLGVWRLGPLRAALPATPAGHSLRAMLAPLSPAEVPAAEGEADDIDTPADLTRHGDT